MIDLNTIRDVPFCGNIDEWPIWSERFLAKLRRYSFKDLLSGNLSIPMADEEIDEGSDSGKKKSMTIKLNDILYTKLLLSIKVKVSCGKVAFDLIKAYKSKGVRTIQMAMQPFHGKG
jgi:hypothetical protein